MRVLYLCHRVPYAPNRGDRIRAYHTLRFLRRQGFDIHVVALAHDAAEVAQAAQLRDLAGSADVVRLPAMRNRVRGAAALAGSQALTHVLLDSGELEPLLAGLRRTFAPDLVFAFCSGMAKLALLPPLRDVPLAVDMVDVDSEKWIALARDSPPPLRWIYARESRLLRRFEARIACQARHTIVVNERERRSMMAIAPDASVTVIENGIDVDYFSPPEPGPRRPDVVFTGVFDYPPNASGAAWLVTEVWPLVVARHPEARLTLVGTGPSRALRALTAKQPSITVTGGVPDVRPYLWASTVGVAPIFVARGLQNKVLEAMAAGLQVVTTPAVADGLPESLRGACRSADTPTAFADAIGASLTANEQGRRPDLDHFRWETTLAALPDLLRSSAGAS